MRQLKSTVNSLLSSQGGLFISNTFGEGMGGLNGDGGLFNSTKTIVSVFHKELAQVRSIFGLRQMFLKPFLRQTSG